MSSSASDLQFLFAKRLKEVRMSSGFSQRRLGMAAGLDEFIAGTRINRYEQSVHQPNIAIAHQLANILNVPAGYFYTSDDFTAQALLLLHSIKPEQQKQVLELLRSFSKTSD